MPDVIRAYVVVRDIFGLRELWSAVEALDNRGRPDRQAQTTLYLESRRLLDRAVRWLVSARRSPLDVPGEIARLRPGVAALLPELDALFLGAERESLRGHTEQLAAAGVPARPGRAGHPADVRLRPAGRGRGGDDAPGRDVAEVAGVYFVLSERFRVDDLLSKISALPREDRWQTLARMALRYDLYAALAALTAEVLSSTAPEAVGGGPGGRVGAGERHGRSCVPATRSASSPSPGRTWRRCRCCCARSARWCAPPLLRDHLPRSAFRTRKCSPTTHSRPKRRSWQGSAGDSVAEGADEGEGLAGGRAEHP